MIRVLFAVIIVVCCCAEASEMTIKAMSFNVRYGTAMDGENAWMHRKDILVNAFREEAPDVCGLQECLAFQAEYIVEQLPEYRWTGIDRDVSGKGEMTAVLYRHKALFPVETGHFWLSETPDAPASVSWDSSLTRMATWLRFYHAEGNDFFYFYNTHLDHKGEQARQKGIAVICEHIDMLPKETPVILVGDFNAPAEQSRPYEIAMENGFSDAWLEAEERIGPPITWSAFKAPDPDQDKRIDWIIYRGPVRVSRCETVLYNEGGRYPSDHYPVAATLHIGKD
ncbi:MAG TPA: endonuclease/exonuclease/phosphatase family protein [Candidatus Hydrogenedentes bacterium]|nr:endonuclease/exonuclease/phosphatase family protein [Candidatus Hydrogenedentota bacterium]